MSLVFYQYALVDKTPIFSKVLNSEVSPCSIHLQCMLIWIRIKCAFINVKEKIKLSCQIDLTTRLPRLPQCTELSKDCLGKLHKFTKIKLTADVTFLFLLSVNNDHFYISQVRTRNSNVWKLLNQWISFISAFKLPVQKIIRMIRISENF